jgi:hypothetical protein
MSRAVIEEFVGDIRAEVTTRAGRFCVTDSVAAGTQRDDQDATGRTSILGLYLAWCADFTGTFANLAETPVRFSSPSRHTGVEDHRLGIHRFASSHRADRAT